MRGHFNLPNWWANIWICLEMCEQPAKVARILKNINWNDRIIGIAPYCHFHQLFARSNGVGPASAHIPCCCTQLSIIGVQSFLLLRLYTLVLVRIYIHVYALMCANEWLIGTRPKIEIDIRAKKTSCFLMNNKTFLLLQELLPCQERIMFNTFWHLP